MVEKQLGESHKITSPGQQHREQSHDEHPPFRTPAQHEHAEHGQQQRHGPQVNGAAGHRLGPPVRGNLRNVGAVIPQHPGDLPVLRKPALRSSPVQVRNQHVESLRLTVTPRRSVLQAESVLLLPVSGSQFATAAHRLGRMAVDIIKHSRITPYGQHGRQRQQSGRFGKMRQYPFPDRKHQLVDPESHQNK